MLLRNLGVLVATAALLAVAYACFITRAEPQDPVVVDVVRLWTVPGHPSSCCRNKMSLLPGAVLLIV
jgi:hypothetical protein